MYKVSPEKHSEHHHRFRKIPSEEKPLVPPSHEVIGEYFKRLPKPTLDQRDQLTRIMGRVLGVDFT